MFYLDIRHFKQFNIQLHIIKYTQLNLLDRKSPQYIVHIQTHTHTNLSISVRMSGRLSAMFVLVPNFLPNGRSHTTTSTVLLGRGITEHTEQISQVLNGHRLQTHIQNTHCYMSSFFEELFQQLVVILLF